MAGLCRAGHLNLFVARIAVASFMAYALGQILDVHVFNRLAAEPPLVVGPYRLDAVRQHQRYRGVFSLSLSGAARTRLWPPTGEIALVDYSFKVLISIIFFLPMYGVLLNMLLKRLADKSDLSALQPS